MGSFLSCQEMARRWGVSARRVGQYCAEGRIAGAQKVGRSWAVPADAEKPADPRRARAAAHRLPVDAQAAEPAFDVGNLMPLMNTPFEPGRCRQAIDEMPPGPRRAIARAEYSYFSGQPEVAAEQAKAHLSAPDAATRLSACLIYAYACLPLGQIAQARRALDGLNASLAVGAFESPQLKAASAFVAAAGAVLLHLPLPKQMPDADSIMPWLPPGLRAFALYVQAHHLYLEGEYARSAGIAEGALAMAAARYPIPAIYLRLVSVMDHMSLKRPDRAQAQLLAAWDAARPDDLIEGFGEHHGLLGAMLEAVIKPRWPEDFRRIIGITYRFSSGWRRVHNPATGDDVADDLTTTEFAIAMLAARDWTTAQIAEHMGISANTVKVHISEAMRKLDVASRKDLKRYMLR